MATTFMGTAISKCRDAVFPLVLSVRLPPTEPLSSILESRTAFVPTTTRSRPCQSGGEFPRRAQRNGPAASTPLAWEMENAPRPRENLSHRSFPHSKVHILERFLSLLAQRQARPFLSP